MTLIRPARLPARAAIGICAPSSRINPEKFEAGCAILQQQGYTLFVHPQTHEAHGQIAGSAQSRAAALMDLLCDDTLDAVFFACGGHRAAEVLPLIDWTECAAAKPKIVMGFSDGSVLVNAITARLGWVGVFGPTVQSFATLAQQNAEALHPAWALLYGHKFHMTLDYNGPAVQGHIVASTLSLLPLLLQSQNIVPLKNAILCVEDCHEELSAVDRLFLFLKQHGVFDNIRALVCGSFSDMTDTGRPFGFTLEEIVRHHAGATPVAFNAPFGHAGPFSPLPVGVLARVSPNGFELVDEPFI